MASRPGIQVTRQREADGGESPNAYAPFVSAHIRTYWPPLATEAEVMLALDEAVQLAKFEIHNRKTRWDEQYSRLYKE